MISDLSFASKIQGGRGIERKKEKKLRNIPDDVKRNSDESASSFETTHCVIGTCIHVNFLSNSRWDRSNSVDLEPCGWYRYKLTCTSDIFFSSFFLFLFDAFQVRRFFFYTSSMFEESFHNIKKNKCLNPMQILSTIPTHRSANPALPLLFWPFF